MQNNLATPQKSQGFASRKRSWSVRLKKVHAKTCTQISNKEQDDQGPSAALPSEDETTRITVMGKAQIAVVGEGSIDIVSPEEERAIGTPPLHSSAVQPRSMIVPEQNIRMHDSAVSSINTAGKIEW